MKEPRTMSALSMDLDQLCINTIRTLAMDAVQAANSGSGRSDSSRSTSSPLRKAALAAERSVIR